MLVSQAHHWLFSGSPRFSGQRLSFFTNLENQWKSYNSFVGLTSEWCCYNFILRILQWFIGNVSKSPVPWRMTSSQISHELKTAALCWKKHNYKTFQINSNKITPQKNVTHLCFPPLAICRPPTLSTTGPAAFDPGRTKGAFLPCDGIKMMGSCLLGVIFTGRWRAPKKPDTSKILLKGFGEQKKMNETESLPTFLFRTKLEHNWPGWKPIGVTMKVNHPMWVYNTKFFQNELHPGKWEVQLGKNKGNCDDLVEGCNKPMGTVSCTLKMGLCLQFALNHILNLRVHPAQNCIVLDLIWISHQFLVTFWGWLNKRVLQLSNYHSESPGSILFSLFQCACFFACFFFVSQKKTHPSIEATVSDPPKKKTNFVGFVLRSGHLSPSLMPVAIGAETAAVSSVGRIPRTNQEGNQSLRYA